MANKLAFSIIIPTRNRVQLLRRCLLSFKVIEDGEIIVVNDASTDKTRMFLNSLGKKNMRIVHTMRNEGKSGARNAGIRQAKGEVVAFIDDDCVPEIDWLKNILAPFKNNTVDFVIGATHYVYQGYRGYFPERVVRNNNAQWPGAGNIAFRKRALEKAGGFDPCFDRYNNEDTELAIRLCALGYRFSRAPKAIVYHQRSTWTTKTLLASAKNTSVWAVLKKRYPRTYQVFGPPIVLNRIIFPMEYLHLAALPFLVPILLIRFLFHGKRDIKVFFAKWPIYLILKRFFIIKEALRQRIFIL